jgi:hypothetical protein
VKPALVISDRDNVATALEPLDAGREMTLNGAPLVVREPIESGHKIALRAIAAGEAVIKYGSPIGLASADIPAGAHVHTHNLSSSRGRGDLDAAPQPATEARLAEPPDSSSVPAGPPAPQPLRQAEPGPGASDPRVEEGRSPR